jgi:CubicO group peptidase (beta-lactamase class C family)
MGAKYTLKNDLNKRRTASLRIMKDGVVHHEHYQYERNERRRFNLALMGKSVLGLFIGLAKEDGAIHSIDDLVVRYLSELNASLNHVLNDSDIVVRMQADGANVQT